MGAGHPRGKSGGDGSQLSAKCSAHKGALLGVSYAKSKPVYDDNADITKSPDPWYSHGNPRRFQPETISKGYPGQHHSNRA